MGYSKAIKSGKLLEIWQYERDLPNSEGIRTPKKRPTIDNIYDFKPTERRKDNLQRQKQAFIRICLSNLGGGKSASLASLTYRDVFPYDDCLRHFSQFIAKLRKSLGETFSYVAVPEYQARGALHFHILFFDLDEKIKPCYYSTEYYYDKTGKKKRKHICPTDYLCERKTRNLAQFWSYGFLDIIQTNSSPKLSFYLGKYLTKQTSLPQGKKRFFASRNILRPVKLSSNKTSIDRPFNKLLNNLTPLQEKSFVTEWLGRATYKSYLLE